MFFLIEPWALDAVLMCALYPRIGGGTQPVGRWPAYPAKATRSTC